LSCDTLWVSQNQFSRNFKKIEDPTVERFDACIMRWEQAVAYKATQMPVAAAAFGAKAKAKQQKSPGQKGQGKQGNKKNNQSPVPKPSQSAPAKSITPANARAAELKASNTCLRCGKKGQHQCDSANLHCTKCNKPGHIDRVCFAPYRNMNGAATAHAAQGKNGNEDELPRYSDASSFQVNT
jgi:hypothetical protein